ncbi:MAG: thioredoxin domain-containing protein [Anaerolineales bacterium]|nr:thioredoxin domain-containing protein [Anaerolineales bacterium]
MAILFSAVSASHANNSVALNDGTTTAIGSQSSAQPVETDLVGIQATEGGTLNTPALVWFHADWCVICQSIKPTVNALEKQYDGKVRIVRLNVDAPEASRYVQKYRVRGTPTFVFFDRHGKVVTSAIGWLDEQRVAQTFEQLIGQP